jgi:hypothetical protein
MGVCIKTGRHGTGVEESKVPRGVTMAFAGGVLASAAFTCMSRFAEVLIYKMKVRNARRTKGNWTLLHRR